MISDSNSVFSMNKILGDGITGHRSLGDVSLKTSKIKYNSISHGDYLIKMAPITNYFSNYIFNILFIQSLIIGFMPNFSQYWSQDKPTEKTIRFFGYFFLVLSPPKQTQIYHIMFVFLVVLFLLMNLIYFISSVYYKKYHSTNIILCYAARYSILIISTIFFPISNSYCAEHFNTIFLKSDLNLNTIKDQVLSLFVTIFFIMIYFYLFDNLLFKHYDVSFQNILFKVWNPWSVNRLYVLMGCKVLLCHFLPPLSESFSSSFPLIPAISLVLTLIVFIFEVFQINWIKNSQHICVLTALLSNIIISLGVMIDCIISKENCNCHPQMVFWISIIFSILGFFISSQINKISINASLKRLQSPIYPYFDPDYVIHNESKPIEIKKPNASLNQHLNKLGSKSLDRINSSFLFKFKRFPSDDSFSSDDDETDLHKSKSNVPRALPPMFKNIHKDGYDNNNHYNNNIHHLSSNEGGSENSEREFLEEQKNSLAASKSDVSQNMFVESHSNRSNNIFKNDNSKNGINDDFKSLESVKCASTVFKDLCVGYMYANEDVIMMNHINRILEKFPNDSNIYFFIARHHFVFKTLMSLSVDEIMEHLAPKSLFNPIQSHMYNSIMRSLEPISINTLSIMESSVHSMNRSFVKLIDSIRSVYNLILYELTTSLPKAILVFQHRYTKSLTKLYAFVQRYPHSPDSEFYVKLYETFFPSSPERKKLNFWLNYRANYSVNDISLFPSHISLMVNYPECLVCNQRETRLRSRDLPDHFKNSQLNNQIKLKEVKGPFKFALKSPLFKFSLLVSILCPLITMILIYLNDTNYLSRSDHIIECYSFMWRIDLMSNCLYPVLFFKNLSKYWVDKNIYINSSNNNVLQSSINEEDNDELFYPNLETMDEYMLNKLKIISNLQFDLLRFSKGVSKYGDTDIFDEISSIFMNRNDSFSNKTLYEIFMFTSFVAEDFLTEDNVYLNKVTDINYGMEILDNIRKNSTYVGNKIYSGLKNINVFRGSIFQSEDKAAHLQPVYFLAPEIFVLIISYIFLSFTLKSALLKLDLFFISLRETSKPAVTTMHNICQQYCNDIGQRTLRNQKKPNVHPYQFNFHFTFPTIIIFALMLIVIGLFVLMTNCYELQTRDTVDTYEKLTVAYHNFTTVIIDIALLQYYHQNMNDSEINQVIDEIIRINSYYQGVNWFYERDFPFYCTLCSLVDIMMNNNNKTKNTYYSSIFEWLGMSQFYTENALYHEDIAKRLINQFFNDVDFLLIDVFDFTKEKIRKTIVITGNVMIFLISLFILLIIMLTVVIYLNIKKADSPFINIISILGRLPENALSKDTCKILGHHQLDFDRNKFEFDSLYYEQVLMTFPHPIIVIDRLMNVKYFNTSALKLINAQDVSQDRQKLYLLKNHRKLFEVMAVDLYEYFDESFEQPEDDDNNNKEAKKIIEQNLNETSFCQIVEDYLFDESCSVLYKRLCTSKRAQHELFYSLTIQPIDDGGRSDVNGFNYFNQKNDFRNFVLILKDIGEEIRQQKMLAQEAQKQSKIVNQIFPSIIAAQLLNNQKPKPMTVSNVAISFCDIVSFTPWCSSQTPEVVVTTLNQMFKIFDQMCAKYDQVIKIKCIGDCYMSAAGVFSSSMINVQPSFISNQNGPNKNEGIAHMYSYNSINHHGSSSKIRTNISITSLIKKKKKKNTQKKQNQTRRNALIKQSSSITDVTLNKDGHTRSASNTNSNNSDTFTTNNSSNNNSEANYEDEIVFPTMTPSSQTQNQTQNQNQATTTNVNSNAPPIPHLNSNQNQAAANLPFPPLPSQNNEAQNAAAAAAGRERLGGTLNKNKIPLIPVKVSNLHKYKTIQVNPHQRSHSKPTIRPSLLFSMDGNFMNHETSEDQRERNSLYSDQLSTASLNDTENDNDTVYTDDTEDGKTTGPSNNNSNSNSIIMDDNSENESNNDTIHHSTSHLGQNEIEAATQMLSFCLDLIDAIEIVNKKLGTQLQVRVGAAFGGPISAGVIGKRMPMFDIWGEIVNEANLMESSGKAMSVHIKKNYYDIVSGECYVFNPYVNERGETTYLVTRA